MGIIRKYAFVLVLALAVVYVYSPRSLENVAKLPWLDDINVILNNSLASANPEIDASRIDPVAAANVDEDLDYRIAQRMKSTAGWRLFLAAHPHGPHAQTARAEFDKLNPAETHPAPPAAQASNGRSPEMKTPTEAAAPGLSPPGLEVATLPTDEVCRRDEDRLERLSSSATSDEAMRFLNESRCEKLRPQLFRLTERLDYQAPTVAAVAAHAPSSRVVPARVASTVAPAPVAKRLATKRQNSTRRVLSSRSVEPRRQANRRTTPRLPPILFALFGDEPVNSTALRRVRAAGGGVAAGNGGVGGATSTSGATGGVASAASTGGGSGGGAGSGAGGGGGSGAGGGGSGGGGGGSGRGGGGSGGGGGGSGGGGGGSGGGGD
jgi:hypothetical protein